MKIVAVCAQKGGAGKTYLATNLAVAAELRGQKAVLFDLDPQSSAVKWADWRADPAPVVMATYPERLPDMIQTAEEHGADFVVIDTPPNTRPPVLESAKAADLVVIPCKPDRVSIEAIGSTISLIETAKVPARIVLNAVNHYGSLAKQSRVGLEIYNTPCAPCEVGDRIAFTHAFNAGWGVQEFSPKSKASSEIQTLCEYINKELEVLYAG